jgi:hypothetical protein
VGRRGRGGSRCKDPSQVRCRFFRRMARPLMWRFGVPEPKACGYPVRKILVAVALPSSWWTMQRVPILVFVAFAALAAAAFTSDATSQGDSRVALVIGNGDYSAAGQPLKQAVPDARALADELRRTSFDVQLQENLTREGMRRALDRFYARIERGSTALIFFSGYGLETKRQNS